MGFLARDYGRSELDKDFEITEKLPKRSLEEY
jgi:hypothetical protein